VLTLWGMESVPSHLRATRRTVGTGKAVPSATGVGRKTANTDDASQRRSHATRGIGKLRRIEERDAVGYCIRVEDDAEEFQAMYGGERVVLPVRKPPAPAIGRRGLWSKRRKHG
jgi:hypothetical protein